MSSAVRMRFTALYRCSCPIRRVLKFITDEAYFHAVDLIFSAINERKEMDSRRMEHLESMINCHLLKLGLTPVSCTKDRGGGWREGVIETSTAIAVAAKRSKVGKRTAVGLLLTLLSSTNTRWAD